MAPEGTTPKPASAPRRAAGCQARLHSACRVVRRAAIGCLVVMASGTGLAAAPREPARSQVPEGLACARDQLTSYTGRVVAYRRSPAQAWLRIATDWQSLEAVTIRATGPQDLERQFLIEGRPFAAGDWPRIEQKPGQLLAGMRATAWVCEGGRRPVVDWQPPAGR